MQPAGPEDTRTVSECDAIARVCQLYIDGGARGEAGKLKEAFHPAATVFGNAGGRRLDVPIDAFIPIACDAPLGTGGRYRGRALSVQQANDAAIAVIAEDGCWGDVSFIDYLSLARFDGVWKIVNKTFALTGGQMPGKSE